MPTSHRQAEQALRWVFQKITYYFARFLERITCEETVVGWATWITRSAPTLVFILVVGGTTAVWVVQRLRGWWFPPTEWEPVLTLDPKAKTVVGSIRQRAAKAK